jgi:hypothetical protein
LAPLRKSIGLVVSEALGAPAFRLPNLMVRGSSPPSARLTQPRGRRCCGRLCFPGPGGEFGEAAVWPAVHEACQHVGEPGFRTIPVACQTYCGPTRR